VALITIVGYRFIPVNATTVGLFYLLFILVVASTWGFIEAAIASFAATLAFNFYFLPPVGTLTIADPQNWVALFSFLATSLIASRLSVKAERRAEEAIARRKDLERLYTFSRAILLTDEHQSFAKQLVQKLAEVFDIRAVMLYDRRTDEVFRGGPGDFDGMEQQLRDSARNGSSFADPKKERMVTSIRLGADPIGALGIQGTAMPDSVLQGIANIVAIGLERARAQDLTHQVEAARRSGQLRTTLLDAIAHEFKTPLTSIRAVTSSLLADPNLPIETRKELLTAADEEAERLTALIDDSLELARLDSEQIDLEREPVSVTEIIREAVASVEARLDGREMKVSGGDALPPMLLDRRLLVLAVRQILTNALKYSQPGSPVDVRAKREEGSVVIEITDYGDGIAPQEQERIFERFYRGLSRKQQIPGSGLGLSIAHSVVQAHGGSLTVTSQPGETTFRLTLPEPKNGVGA
jgi:two-component system sensor histidine kinase KdpD